MADRRRFGLGKNLSPEEAGERLALPCLLILLGLVLIDFNRSTGSSPADLVYIRRAANSHKAQMLLGTEYRLESNILPINGKQWKTAVVPVLEKPENDMSLPINRVLLTTGGAPQILSRLREDLVASFQAAGYGPLRSTSLPSPQPFVPSDIEGLLLWFDASDLETFLLNESSVIRWSNKALETFNASQQEPLLQPLLTLDAEDLASVSFNGIDQFLTLPFPAVRDVTLVLVGDSEIPALSPKGTWFAATGLETPYSGPDLWVSDLGVLGTSLRERDFTGPTLSGDRSLIEFVSQPQINGSVEFAVGGVSSVVFEGNTSSDYWDPSRLLGGQSPPLLASLGRSQRALVMGDPDYFQGSISELLLFDRILTPTERQSLRSYLQKKWRLS